MGSGAYFFILSRRHRLFNRKVNILYTPSVFSDIT